MSVEITVSTKIEATKFEVAVSKNQPTSFKVPEAFHHNVCFRLLLFLVPESSFQLQLHLYPVVCR